MSSRFCRWCGMMVKVIGFVAGSRGSIPVFIKVCPSCD